ncbi:MAG TPA: fibronectin-binding domain-containing protein [candidate division Zixibacteria bacterium]|nr:fibronectin-binding domain-containing protein [candidate division Zixibacteria bacterium]HER00687.1 fibronectin-binding domain-containing protein [candidate division Zixibacteria bacterium]
MKITALHTARLVSEFRQSLPGARIRKLRKSERDKTIVMHLEDAHDRYSLIFHFGGKDSYLYLLDGFYTRITTTNFLPQLLDARIINICQIDFDRVVQFDIEDDERSFKLIFELFGISSNLFLTDGSGTIITSIRKAKLDLKSYRAPEPLKLANPLEFDVENIMGMIGSNSELSLREAILKTFAGIDEGMLRDFEEEGSNVLDEAVSKIRPETIRNILCNLRKYCADFIKPETELSHDPESESILLSSDGDLQQYSSISDIFRQYAAGQTLRKPKSTIKSSLAGQLKRAIKKDTKKQAKLEEQLGKAEEYPDLQRRAELLAMNLHKAGRGMDSIELEDVYSDRGGVIRVELEKSLTPGQNVERLFARAKKLKEKIPGIREEIQFTKDRLERLEKLRSELDRLASDELPQELERELAEFGIRPPGRGRKAEPRERLPYKRYTSSSGEEIWVGRSAANNDILTFKYARKYDLWLHSQQTSGSHVILRRPNKNHQFQKSSIVEAAEIAAFFSTAKKSDSVPVIYTEVKYVRKLRKGRPGEVLADRTKSILVTPRRPKN